MTQENHIEDAEYQAEKALKERPRFSIRSRLLLGFMLFFILSAAAELTAIITLHRLEEKTRFLVIADRYTYEIQQARRFEKNFFLYQTDLQYVFDHVGPAESLMNSNSQELRSVLGDDNYIVLNAHLEKYKELLFQLAAIDTVLPENAETRMSEIENELRQYGSQMITFALQLSERELDTVRSMFRWAKLLPLIFLVFFLILVIYMANFLFRQINRPLSRLMELTERIAEGDLTPITPFRKYRDEFSNVNMALNHMIHELKRRQELMIESHKLRAIGTLTAGIAHELNNPLNNITLTAAVLEEDYENISDEQRLELVRDLVKEAQRSERIVRNLLGFARKSEIETKHLDISDLIAETLKLAQNQVNLKGVKVTTSIPVNLPKIHGDRQQLNQVFLNLILNALDAIDKNGKLNITAETTSMFDFITIKFTDNGSGIPHHILPSIFDPFFTTKPTRRGTGLGLSVSKGIIEEHGGNITVESEVGTGTTFIISLPIARIPAEFK
ncbi:MAG: HAMP domain-containing protein [Candidatus Zixiibacteriota bacterium]|nr:MAG: HAMP domain-containing protein [candidate division Zixibacteria bacterium]